MKMIIPLSLLGCFALGSSFELWKTSQLSDSTSPACQFCYKFLPIVQDKIIQPKYVEAVEKIGALFCKEVPKDQYNDCIKYDKVYGDMFVKQLAPKFAASEVCPRMPFCATATRDLEAPSWAFDSLGKQSDTSLSVSIVPVCQFCHEFVPIIRSKISEAQYETEIKNIGKMICQEVPAENSKDCSTYIDKYAGDFISYFAQELDPQSICSQLPFCTMQTLLEAIPAQPLVNCEMKCTFCRIVMTAVEVIYRNDRPLPNTIMTVMENACKEILIPSWRESCLKYVEKNGNAIIATLKNFTPPEVCQMLGECPGSN